MQTTPPQSASLVSLGDLKDELGIDATDTSLDARLTRLAGVATGMIEGYCGRSFGLATYSELFNLSGYTYAPKRLVLSCRPVVSVLSVTEGGDILLPAGFVCSGGSGILRRRRGFGLYGVDFPEHIPGGVPTYYLDGSEWLFWYPAEIAVSYTAGYQLPDDAEPVEGALPLPADVTQAAIECVKMLFFSGGSNTRDPRIRSENVMGVGSVSYLDPTPGNGGLPDYAAAVLLRYRNGGLG